VDTVRSAPATRRSWFGDVALVVFLLAQASDGILTYIGVRTFGLAAEGNPIVAWLMGSLGHGAGLTAAKVAAGGLGILLHLSQVHVAVALLTGFYLVAAIGPWVILLFLWS
jgi:hypothetical protein